MSEFVLLADTVVRKSSIMTIEMKIPYDGPTYHVTLITGAKLVVKEHQSGGKWLWVQTVAASKESSAAVKEFNKLNGEDSGHESEFSE